MSEREDEETRRLGDAEMLGAWPLGTAAGSYTLTGFIARGGCGSVYRAQHRSHGGTAAVKILHDPLASLPKVVERFAREIEVVSLLRHPNIVEIFEVGAIEGERFGGDPGMATPFYAMEYLEGRTVAQLLAEEGRLAPEAVLGILEPTCAALSAAHAAGVVHRDVKASNILVVDGAEGEPQRVKLLDFGVAKLMSPGAGARGLTSEGRRVGTLSIMAPEQLLGGQVDERTDIYALGVLLYRLLTGRLPFDGKSPQALVQQHLEEPAPRPSQRFPLPAALDAVVLRCLEKRPERRFESVGELVSALRYAASAPRQRRDSPSLERPGVALHVTLQLRTDHDDLDDALADDVGRVLDLAEERLHAGGFILASATGNELLGVRAIALDAARAIDDRRRALQLAGELVRAIEARPAPDARVKVAVRVHAGELHLRASGRPEVAGGALLDTSRWAIAEIGAGLAATPAVLQDLELQ